MEQRSAKLTCWDLNAHQGALENEPNLFFSFFVIVCQTWQELRMVAWGCSSGVTLSRSSASEVLATPESPGYDSTTRGTRLQNDTHTHFEQFTATIQTSNKAALIMFTCAPLLTVVGTVASQQEGPRLDSRLGASLSRVLPQSKDMHINWWL